MQQTRSSIKVTRLSFTAKEFSTLPRQERLFFVRLAHAYNDLRHIQQLVDRARNCISSDALRTTPVVCCSQRGLEDSAFELGKKFYPKLTIGKEAYDFL